ncbi:STAS domain-containing protein [Ideonella sp. B508-1]|uniref:STAS domain-containing protein n=1 Tax=Ideonella sp. B508-1 TaxID=137716 RepID=UPI000345A2FD|nr:STAS domain-containing protein [Ideonella sp. B508-1]
MNTAQVLRLDGELTIYRAQEVRQLLLETLARPEGLQLDLGEVSEMDSSAVQLLLAARQEALAAGKTFVILQASDPVGQVLALLGLEDLLQETAQGEPA